MFNRNYTFLIAEAGVNHNGKIKNAYELIDIASDSGADAVKFQTFKAENICVRDAPKAVYQIKTDKNGSQFNMLRKLELSFTEFKNLANYAKKKRIVFLSTPFDKKSVDYLVDELKVEAIKIPSGEINNFELIDHISKKKVPVILSSGASKIDEITIALNLLKNGKKLTINSKNNKFLNKDIKTDKNLALLHCVSEYPAPIDEANIKCIESLKKKFGWNIGYSDHCMGLAASISAVFFGATIVEKHFTISRKMDGPDHFASVEPDELNILVKTIRNLKPSFGKSNKIITQSEKKNRKIIRRSLVASKKIKKGELFNLDNLTTKRPALGINACHYFEYIGQRASRDYMSDELINEKLINKQ